MSIAHLTIRHAFPSQRAARLFAVLIAASVAVGCGGSDDGPTYPSGAPSATVTVQATPAIQFTPATVELSVGGTVTFEFGAVPHNVYFDNAPAGASTNITTPTASESVTRTFATAGQYRYNCHLHPGMSGTINVR